MLLHSLKKQVDVIDSLNICLENVKSLVIFLLQYMMCVRATVSEDSVFLFYISLLTLDKLKLISEATIRHILGFRCSILFKRTTVVNICLALTFLKDKQRTQKLIQWRY